MPPEPKTRDEAEAELARLKGNQAKNEARWGGGPPKGSSGGPSSNSGPNPHRVEQAWHDREKQIELIEARLLLDQYPMPATPGSDDALRVEREACLEVEAAYHAPGAGRPSGPPYPMNTRRERARLRVMEIDAELAEHAERDARNAVPLQAA